MQPSSRSLPYPIRRRSLVYTSETTGLLFKGSYQIDDDDDDDDGNDDQIEEIEVVLRVFCFSLKPTFLISTYCTEHSM